MSPQSGVPVEPLGQSTMGNERPSTAWSQDDDTLLMRSRAQGMNWAPIAQNHFPKKTPNACRKRHERLMERKNAENWDGVKLEDLARAYVESREIMWKIIADKVGEKWQHVETKCMEKGLKTLQAAARSRRTRATSTSPTSPGGGDENDLDGPGLNPDPPGSDAPDPSSYHQSPSHQSHQSHHQSPHHGSSHHQHQSHSHQAHQSHQSLSNYQSGPPSSHHGNSPGVEWTPRGSGSRSSFSSTAGYVFPSQTLPGGLGGSGVMGGSLGGGGNAGSGGSARGEAQGPKLPSFSSGFPQQQLPGISALYHPQASYC